MTRGTAHRYRIQWLLLGIALLTVGALIGYSLYSEHDGIDARERDRLQAQARIVDENLGRQMEGVNHALAGVRDEFLPWGSKKMEKEAARHLNALSGSIPGLRTLGILDARGTVLASNRDELIGRDFSEREYFRIASARPNPDTLYVSPPFNTALEVFSINLTRAVVGPKGEFAGIVTATLAPEYFAVLLNSVLYTPGMRSSIVHGDGRIVIEEPNRKDLAGMDLAKSGSRYTMHTESGRVTNIFVGTAYSTGDERMSAWRTIRPASLRMDKPLMVSVNRDAAGIFASWHRRVYVQGGLFGALLLITTLGLLAYQRRQMAYDRLKASYETERKRAEETFQQSERLLKNAETTAHIGYYEIDVNTGKAVWSEETFRIFGLDPYGGEPTLETYRALVHPDDAAIVDQRFADSIEDQSPFDLNYRIVHSSGEIRYVHSISKVSTNPASAVIRMFGTLQDITERKRAEQALHDNAKRLRNLSRRLITVEETVRRTINRELHDRVGASLSALNLNLSIVRSQLPPESLRAVGARIEDTQRLLEETTTHVRDLMADLHPPALDDYGLFAALRTYVHDLGARIAVPISMHGEPFVPRLPLVAETALFRVVQGALVNAITHAHPERIEILLAASPDRVALTIADDGVGFDVADTSMAHASWGLAIMRERAEAVGAELTVESTPGKGTRVCVEISREKR